jgi:hypothetical protein
MEYSFTKEALDAGKEKIDTRDKTVFCKKEKDSPVGRKLRKRKLFKSALIPILL